MEIVYINRRDGEKCVHIELSSDEAAALADGSAEHAEQLRRTVEDADRRLNPGRAPGAEAAA